MHENINLHSAILQLILRDVIYILCKKIRSYRAFEDQLDNNEGILSLVNAATADEGTGKPIYDGGAIAVKRAERCI